MPASFEMRGPVVTHDPNLRIDQSLGKLPVFDPAKLIERLIDELTKHMEEIPILGDLVKVLRQLLDTDGDGHLELEDLIGLLTGRGLLNGLAALFGGASGLPLGSILTGLQQMFSGLTPGGKFDAGKLVGELPMAIINTIKGFLSAVFDLGLLRITPNMIFGGNSDNLLLASDFKAAESMVVGDGWFWDGAVGRSAPGSAKASASGNRLVQLSNLVRVEAGQKLDVAGWVKWSGVAASGDAFRVECQCYTGASTGASLPVGVISSPSASGGWQQINGQVTIPASVDGVRVRIAVEAAVTAGSVWWDDVTAVRVGTMPQNFITNLIPDLAGLRSFVQNVIDSIMNGFGFFGSGFGLGALLDQIGKVFTSDGSIPQANVPIISDIIKAVTGYTSGQGAPSGSNAIGDMLTALGRFTGSTNSTAITADQANGVGSNALTNTVNIQAQLQGVQDVQDAGWTARPLWASMDYTADATFPLYLMQRQTAHAHTTGNLNHKHDAGTYSANSGSGSVSGMSGDASTIGQYNPVVTVGTTSVAAEFGAYTFTSSQAYVGFIRCGSVQEKRLFSFRAYYTAAPSAFYLDIYRLDKATGTMTLLHTSSNLAGALTTSAQWVQYVIPAGTASINVQPGDILGVQFRITSGTVALQGLDSLIPSNPPGFLPRRVGMLRSGTISAPATMAESIWSSAAGFVPYIEAGIDTGQASAPLSISDNFDGSLSNQWMMSGANEIGITSNNIGILQSGTSLADGWSWGKFNTQLRTDQAEVGITATSTSAEEQVVWFKGSGPNLHVGLAISSSYATLYTMAGGTRTNRVQVAIGTVDADYKVRYTASSKVFAVFRNGAQIGSWTDSGNVAPTGLGNRFGGVGLHATRGTWFGLGSTKASPIDNWVLADI